ICEWDGTNNSWCADNKQLEIPNVQVTVDTLEINRTEDGEVSVSGTVTVTNNGCGADLTDDLEVRYTLFGGTGGSGTQVEQWTQTFTGVSIPSGGGTQTFTVPTQIVTADMVTQSNNCQASILIESDYNNVICECDNSDNEYVADNIEIDIPNIAVPEQNVEITCEDNGQIRFSGDVTVSNNGCGSPQTTNIPVRFTLYDGAGCTGTQLAQWTDDFTSANITAGGGTQVFNITDYTATADVCALVSNCTLSLLVEADYTNITIESDGTDNTLCSSITPQIPDINVSGVATSVICQGDGDLTGTTVTVSNDGCGDATGVVVRLTSDCGLTFDEQTVDIAAGQTSEMLFLFTAGITNCTCGFTAVADPDNLVCECDETNNTRSGTMQMTIPDIEISSENLVVECAGSGMYKVSGSVTLVNNGCGNNLTQGVPVQMTLFGGPGGSGTGLTQWNETFSGVNVAPGGSQTFTIQPHEFAINLCAMAPGCEISMLIDADYTDSICEWDGTNNQYTSDKTSECFDLAVGELTITADCSMDDTMSGQISATVTNSGTDDITEDFHISVDDGMGWTSEKLFSAELGGPLPLTAGATFVVTFDWDRDFSGESVDCTFDAVTVRIDSQGVICQCSEENDSVTESFNLGLPNLRPIAVIPQCSGDGLYSIQVTIENNGCSDAGNFSLKLSDDQGNSQTVNVNGAAAGGTVNVSLTDWPATCEPAKVNFTAEVISETGVCEVRDDDNTMVQSYTNPSPDMVITGVNPTVNITAGSTIEITVLNNGNAAITSDFKINVNDGKGWSTSLFFNANLGGPLPLAAGASATVTVDWNREFGENGSYTCYFEAIMVSIDVEAGICECGIDNNETSVSFSVGLPDIVVDAIGPGCSSDGERELEITISNIGCGPVEDDFGVRIDDGNGNISTFPFTELGGQLPLEAGTTQVISSEPWPFDCSNTSMEYTVTVDPNGEVSEIRIDNNDLTEPYPLSEPNLEWGDIEWTCNGDGTITFTVTVVNSGPVAATSVPVTVYDGNGTLVYSGIIDTIPAGGSHVVTFTTGVYPSGQELSFRFVVDESLSVCECNGNDNEATITVNCEGGGTALEVGQDCSHGHQQGGVYNYELTINNSGSTDLTGVVVNDILPEGFTYVPGSSVLSGVSIADPEPGPPMTWSIGTVEAGAQLVLIFNSVTDADTKPGRYCNTAWVSTGTMTSEESQCCSVVTRKAGAGCCLRIEEYPQAPVRRTDGPVSFIEPYFQTESAMFTVYTALNLWRDEAGSGPGEKDSMDYGKSGANPDASIETTKPAGVAADRDSMELFMKERLLNYARSTVEEFYLQSHMGAAGDDGTLWLSYGGAYPERAKESNRWVRKSINKTMTASQIAFELLALNEVVKVENRETVRPRLEKIIRKKLEFLANYLVKSEDKKDEDSNLPHAWDFEEKKDKKKTGKEAEVDIALLKKYNITVEDKAATFYDRATLYLAMNELKEAGYAGAGQMATRLRIELKRFDNENFDVNNLKEEFVFMMSLLKTGEKEKAAKKYRQFERTWKAVEKKNTEGTEKKTEDTERKKGKKKGEKNEQSVLKGMNDYSMAIYLGRAVDGEYHDEMEKRFTDKYYLKDTGIYVEEQPDFTFKMELESLAGLMLLFDSADTSVREAQAAVLYRIFDEVGLFLKKRNISVGKPLYSLVKNSPYSGEMLPVLSFNKGNSSIAPVFSRDAVVHSTQVEPLGEAQAPGEFTVMMSPSYETHTSRITGTSFSLQYLGRILMTSKERVISEEGRSSREAGMKYIDALLNSGAGLQKSGKTLVPFSKVAVKGSKDGLSSLEPADLGTGNSFSSEVLADYMLAEKIYVRNDGKEAVAVGKLMEMQKRIVTAFKKFKYVPETFKLHIDESDELTIVPSQERASKVTAAKLYYLMPKDKQHKFLKKAISKKKIELEPEDLIFLSAVPEVVSYFKEDIAELINRKDSKVSLNAADVLGRRVLGKTTGLDDSLENLYKSWDKNTVLPKSDRISHIEKGLIHNYEPQQIVLYLLATYPEATYTQPGYMQVDTVQPGAAGSGVGTHAYFRFNRTLNVFTHLLENEWGVNRGGGYLTLPSMEYRVFGGEPKERVEPGDILSMRVRVENICPDGFGSATELPSLFIKGLFSPRLVYFGTRRTDGLESQGDFKWKYRAFPEGSVLEYNYRAFVPYEYTYNFIDGAIYVGGRQGFESFGLDSAAGSQCEDIFRLKRLNIVPFEELSGLVYEDRNANGIKDTNELGIANILIKDTRGRIFRSDADGRFTVLAGDSHEGLQIDLTSVPDGYVFLLEPTRLVNRNYVGEIAYPLVPCENVEGFVYIDANGSGAFDVGETRLSGVVLETKGKAVVSGAGGRFRFNNLPVLWKDYLKVSDSQPFYTDDMTKVKFEIL
ncbi:MAG: DUF11 domain-containing protein, partial [bacterium]|nr:DUF11 domain-containing protein [bacterium]